MIVKWLQPKKKIKIGRILESQLHNLANHTFFCIDQLGGITQHLSFLYKFE